jgi:trk system potassium uptake protein TrkA
MKSYVVIGLGRFGSAVAQELCRLGHEVLAIDQDPERTAALADSVTCAAACDATNAEALASLGVRNFDCAVMAIGTDIGSSTLITLNLKELGVPEVICKASSHVQRRLLEKIGADQVIFPEHEMGIKLAQNLAGTNLMHFLELSRNYSLVEVQVPKAWRGKTIRELNIRQTSQVNVVAVRRSGEDELLITPGPDHRFQADDRAIVVGATEAINALSGG